MFYNLNYIKIFISNSFFHLNYNVLISKTANWIQIECCLNETLEKLHLFVALWIMISHITIYPKSGMGSDGNPFKVPWKIKYNLTHN